MRKLLQENRVFALSYLTVLIIVFSLKLFFSKEEIFLFVNSHHSPLADFIFPYITYLGDGITIIVISILLLWVRFQLAIQSVIIYIVSSEITQILKRFVFEDYARPGKYFEGIAELHFVEGIEIHKMMSFPSGHTTSVFAFITFLVLISKNKSYSILFLALACIAAYSRIYLAQHFLEDTIAGSLIGVFSAIVITLILENSKWFNSPKLKLSLRKK